MRRLPERGINVNASRFLMMNLIFSQVMGGQVVRKGLYLWLQVMPQLTWVDNCGNQLYLLSPSTHDVRFAYWNPPNKTCSRQTSIAVKIVLKAVIVTPSPRWALLLLAANRKRRNEGRQAGNTCWTSTRSVRYAKRPCEYQVKEGGDSIYRDDLSM